MEIGLGVAEAVLDSTTGTSSIWLYDIARKVRTRFTFSTTDQTSPVWSPDGRWLIFDRFKPEGGDVWIADGIE